MFGGTAVLANNLVFPGARGTLLSMHRRLIIALLVIFPARAIYQEALAPQDLGRLTVRVTPIPPIRVWQDYLW